MWLNEMAKEEFPFEWHNFSRTPACHTVAGEDVVDLVEDEIQED